MKLQINTSGSWKTVVEFDASRKAEVRRAVLILGEILGEDASWCIVDDNGKRQWIDSNETPWIAIEIEHVGWCQLPVRGGMVHMPDVTVRDIVSKACAEG